VKLIADPYERSTAATDALIALVALAYAREFAGHRERDRLRAQLWSGAFGAMGGAAWLGVIAHGLELTPAQRRAVWRPLHVCLGMALACFAAGAVYDTWGKRAARRAFVSLTLGAFGFTALAERIDKGFLAFVAYESVALVFALGAYTRLAWLNRLPGAGRISAGILLTLLAAVVQTQPRRVRVAGVALDHNGLFHLVQIAALPPLAAGVRTGFA
jgi:hypothetical protein